MVQPGAVVAVAAVMTGILALMMTTMMRVMLTMMMWAMTSVATLSRRRDAAELAGAMPVIEGLVVGCF